MDNKKSDENKLQFKEKLDELRNQLSELQESDAKLKQFRDALNDSEKRSRVAEEALYQRIRLEQIVNEISINLIGADTDKLDEAINMAIKTIGETTGVDRSYIFLFSEDLETMSNTHEWCNKGVDPQIDHLQNLSADIFPWWMSWLKRHENIHIPWVKDLPPEANVEKEMLEEQDIQSLIVVPMTYKNRLIGFVGFDSVKEEKKWTNEDIGLLRVVSNLFAMALERKHGEEERHNLKERLRHSQKMEAIGLLAGGIAHDFNNILGAIIGYTELAIMDIPDGNQAKANLAQVLSAAERAKDTIKQILTFSRKSKEEKTLIYLSDVVNEALILLRSTLPATIEIQPGIDKELIPIIANPTQINQLVINLCTNAAYAMREKGGILKVDVKEIDVDADGPNPKTLAPGKYQLLSVSDTGHGMPPEIMERIFEPYFTTKKKGEGTGMGLAMVHGIVTGHGGDITVSSQPAAGTTFRVYLPVTGEEAADVPEKPQNQPIQGGNERILFVDDEHTLVEVGEKMLTKLGYHVVTKTNSSEALEMFRSHPDQFDLVITDQTMLHMTGIRLTGEIKAIRPDIPVILCTGFSEDIDEENYKTRGVSGFIMKPLSRKKLAAVIRRVLENK
jgi:signal transduction histidine kinase/ActR/RegA family two-component response regulator